MHAGRQRLTKMFRHSLHQSQRTCCLHWQSLMSHLTMMTCHPYIKTTIDRSSTGMKNQTHQMTRIYSAKTASCARWSDRSDWTLFLSAYCFAVHLVGEQSLCQHMYIALPVHHSSVSKLVMITMHYACKNPLPNYTSCGTLRLHFSATTHSYHFCKRKVLQCSSTT